MIKTKILEQSVKNSVIFLTFFVVLISISPYFGMSVFESEPGNECYSVWFSVIFFLICSYALTCLFLWARKVTKK